MKKEFRKIKDEGYWFSDLDEYQLGNIPLSDRLEEAVINILNRKVEVTFDEVLEEIYTRFTDALTPTSKDVREILEEYAEKREWKGWYLWKLKPTARRSMSQHQHSAVIRTLAELGQNFSYSIWIGRNEQGQEVNSTKLSDLVSNEYKNGLSLMLPQNILGEIENIDILWIKGDIKYAFEVEHTTSITEAARRLKSIRDEARRMIVIPKDRSNILRSKMEKLIKAEMISGEDLRNFRKIYFEDLISSEITDLTSFEDIFKEIKITDKDGIYKYITLDKFSKSIGYLS